MHCGWIRPGAVRIAYFGWSCTGLSDGWAIINTESSMLPAGSVDVLLQLSSQKSTLFFSSRVDPWARPIIAIRSVHHLGTRSLGVLWYLIMAWFMDLV